MEEKDNEGHEEGGEVEEEGEEEKEEEKDVLMLVLIVSVAGVVDDMTCGAYQPSCNT